jgi:hypothetical protein
LRVELLGMRNRSKSMAAAAAWVVMAFAHTASGSEPTFVAYSGTATALRSGKFLYNERHVLQYRDGKIAARVVLYTCRDGAAFARKTVSYVDALAPDFLLEDASSGMREGIRSVGNTRQVFFRGDGAASEKSGALPDVPGLVADAGFDTFLRLHWDALVNGNALGMNFVVPSRLNDIGFKVQHVRSDQVDGVPVEVFRLKLSGILGWFVSGIDGYYSASDHTLIRYVGLSDLRDAANDNFQAQIDFPPGDRAPSDARAMADARQAHLAPCR